MIDSRKVVAVVTARAGSQGVPGKNYRLLHGRPLFLWSVLAAMRSEYVDHVLVSSNCEQVKKETAQFNKMTFSDHLTFVDRPDELSTATSKNEEALLHAVQYFEENYEALDPNDIIINLQPTSPIRNDELLDKCIDSMHDTQTDSLLTVSRETPFFWKIDKNKPTAMYDVKNRPMRQSLSDQDFMWHDNGNVYAMTVATLSSHLCRVGNNPFLYETSSTQGYQIDTEEDFLIMEAIIGTTGGCL